MSAQKHIVIGRIGAVYGLKGWVKVFSYTSPMENLLQYKHCMIRHHQDSKGEWKPAKIIAGKTHGKGLVIQLEGCEQREQAKALNLYDIAVASEQLPDLPEGDYYWHQLEGLQVITTPEFGSQLLGQVDHLLTTGANDVLVVKPCSQSVDDKERLLPYVPGQYVTEIDLASQVLTIAWDPEF